MVIQNSRVSIGLPVHNGENFVREAIDSILVQTFEDFELIISDNGSTDETEEICREYAAQDKRVRYYRNKENMGASTNYTRLFELASGEYFKWAAHDDVCRPDFLARCVEVLDRDPTVVLCYTRTITIDARGRFGKEWPSRPEFASPIPYRRFREVFARRETFAIWGLIRSNVLKKTRLLGNFAAHDRPLLTELSLHGRFYEIPDFLFLEREHNQRSVRAYDFRNPYKAIVWYDPKRAGRLIFPAWRLFAEHVAGINRGPINWSERAHCYIEMVKWLRRCKQDMVRDLVVAGTHISGVGSILARGYQRHLETRWVKETKRAAEDIESLISTEDIFILVDEGTFNPEIFARWRTIPFLERDGKYWGPPADEATAIGELERLRRSGANFIVFGWPTFWWLDHYVEFHRYLRSLFCCVKDNDRVIVFDMRRQSRSAGMGE